jgi:hypothetical protein
VVTSAGGQAVTDGEGEYQLEIQLPLEASSVQVSAFLSRRNGTHLASVRADLAGSSSTQLAPLILVPGGCCQPGWIPTFGCRTVST